MSTETIPLVDLSTVHSHIEDELVDAFRQAVRSGRFIGGPEIEAFEQEFGDYCGVPHCIGVSSGTDALRFALIAAGVGSGDAVVTVAHTFIATVEAISQAGAATEFVDIDARTYCMSPDALDDYLRACKRDPTTGRTLGSRTGLPIRAIVPVHIYGQVADMDAILATAARYDLVVVEDACQAHGAMYQSRDGHWRRAGSFGQAAAFSFYPGKNLGALGEAGAVTTRDHKLAQTVRRLREHGQIRKYYHECEGYNGRLDAVQASFLRIKLRYLDDWTALRRAAATRYEDLLSQCPGIVRPYEPAQAHSVYHLYVIQATRRDRVARLLNAVGICTGLHYPVPLHLQNCYRGWGYTLGSLPVTERTAANVLSLPMFPGLTEGSQQRVAAALLKAVGDGEDVPSAAVSDTEGTRNPPSVA